MRPKRWTWIAWLLAAALALAACSDSAGNSGQIPQTGDDDALETGAVMPVSSAQMVGDTVVDADGAYIGEVSDVTLGAMGTVMYVLVTRDSGEVLAVPWQAFVWSEGSSTLVYSLPPATLEDAPHFERVSDFDAAGGWGAAVSAYWSGVEGLNLPGVQEGDQVLPSRSGLAMNQQVVDSGGEVAGTVVEVLFGGANSNRYVVLQRDERFVPVPWPQFEWNTEAQQLIYTGDPARLGQAPSFDSLDALYNSDPNWDVEVIDFWGYTSE